VLYAAFGWQPPVFAHGPNVLRQDGRGKLSKRTDYVATNRFWERGYLPAAVFNYLALQGWSYDDQTEIMSPEQIVARFSLDRVHAAPARWNPEKLKDMNGIYIRTLPPVELVERIIPFFRKTICLQLRRRPRNAPTSHRWSPSSRNDWKNWAMPPNYSSSFFVTRT